MSTQQFKAGDILKVNMPGFSPNLRVMFLKLRKKDNWLFRGIVVKGDVTWNQGDISKSWNVDSFELANDPAPSQPANSDSHICDVARQIIADWENHETFAFGGGPEGDLARLATFADNAVEKLRGALRLMSAPSQPEAEQVSPGLIEAAKAVVSAYLDGYDHMARLSGPVLQLQKALIAHEAATEEVPPIPEKWCIKRTPENAEIVNEWATKQRDGRLSYDADSGYVHSQAIDTGSYGRLFDEIQLGYTEITTAQFIRYVLKQS